jgi:hypothetical protein
MTPAYRRFFRLWQDMNLGISVILDSDRIWGYVNPK